MKEGVLRNKSCSFMHPLNQKSMTFLDLPWSPCPCTHSVTRELDCPHDKIDLGEKRTLVCIPVRSATCLTFSPPLLCYSATGTIFPFNFASTSSFIISITLFTIPLTLTFTSGSFLKYSESVFVLN